MTKHSNVFLFVLSTCILCASFFLSSCSTSDDRTSHLTVTQPEQETEWTVLLYLAGNYEGDRLDNGASRAIETLRQLEELNDIESVQVIACFSSPETGGHATIRRITHRRFNSDEQITSEVLRDLGMMDMSSPESFRALLHEGVYNHPSQHIVLAVDGSGDGWEGCCMDDARGNSSVLDIKDMRAVLNDFVERDLDGPVDLLIWMSPEMSSVEVALEFEDLAEYMVASPRTTPVNHYDAIRTWYMDLTANPQMSASELGNRVLDAAYQRAAIFGDDIHLNLYKMSFVSRIGTSIDGFAGWFNLHAAEHSSRLQELREVVWSNVNDDSNHVDLTAFLNALETDVTLNQISDLISLVSDLRQATENSIIGRVASHNDDVRDGMMVYYPLDIDSITYGSYVDLQIAETSPQWSSYLAQLVEQSGSRVQADGLVKWPGHDLAQYNLYLFLNNAQVGAPSIIQSAPIALASQSTLNEAQFNVSFPMNSDSIGAYLGIFADLDGDGVLSSGDRFGYHTTPPALRDWLTIYPGYHLTGLNVLLGYNQN